MKKKILVTGGCGYIGSHTIVDLIENGFEVISIDNNSNSDIRVLEGIRQITGVQVKNYTVDLCDLEKTRKVFAIEKFDGIIHFAALKNVGESVYNPLQYFHNNITSLINVLDCALKNDVKHFIFSSSCSVYGNAEKLPVTENTPLSPPESPYARTKVIGEDIITDFINANKDFSAILLRYFNPAGAHESALIGESPINKAANLVPVITETGIKKREGFDVFGNDYDTRDGSCIRDYIHVMDLANAHTKSLQYAMGDMKEKVEVFNVGIGNGVSVLEAIKAFENVTDKALNYKIAPRREGDVVAIYADYSKAEKVLGWTPKRNIEDIMRTAWKWEQVRSGVLQE